MRHLHGTDIIGRWWLPSAPDQDEAGTLHIDEHGDMELSIHGALHSTDWWNRQSLPPTPIIWGLTNSHRLITLVGSLPRAYQLAMPGFRTERYAPQAALFGDFLTWEDLQFSAARVSFPGLSQWLGVSGLQSTRGISDAPAVSVDRPSIPNITLGDGTTVTVDFQYRQPKLGHVDEHIYLTYRFRDELGLDEATNFTGDLRALLSIHYGVSVAPDQLSLFSARRTAPVSNNEDPATSPLDLVRPWIHSEPDTERANDEALFAAYQHKEGLDGLLRNWHAVADRYRRVIEVASALYYAPQRYRNPELLLATTMAETVHRLSGFPQKTEREGMESWRRLVEVAPRDLEDWLAAFVAELEEPSLRRRLKDLIDALGDLGKQLTANVPKYELRLNWWRNAAVHHSETNNLSGAHMLQLAVITRLAVELFLMREVGYDLAAQSERIQQIPRFRTATRLKLEWPPLSGA